MGIMNIAYMSKNNLPPPPLPVSGTKFLLYHFELECIEILLFKKLPDVVVETFCAFRSLFGTL